MTAHTYTPDLTSAPSEPRAVAGTQQAPIAPVSVEMDGRTIELDGAAAAAVRDLLGHFARGEGVYVGAVEELLTTARAAELMGVSRTHVCNLMDREELPFRHVGTHRRVRAADVLAHVERQRAATRQGLDEIAELGHAHGLYEDDV
ncbi:helix-turn-helix domain-containing protein [Kytococcus sp. Marseille-QA3725]